MFKVVVTSVIILSLAILINCGSEVESDRAPNTVAYHSFDIDIAGVNYQDTGEAATLSGHSLGGIRADTPGANISTAFDDSWPADEMDISVQVVFTGYILSEGLPDNTVIDLSQGHDTYGATIHVTLTLPETGIAGDPVINTYYQINAGATQAMFSGQGTLIVHTFKPSATSNETMPWNYRYKLEMQNLVMNRIIDNPQYVFPAQIQVNSVVMCIDDHDCIIQSQ